MFCSQLRPVVIVTFSLAKMAFGNLKVSSLSSLYNELVFKEIPLKQAPNFFYKTSYGMRILKSVICTK